MNCECPGCKKSFPVDPNKVPPDGVFARCSNCSQVFFVQIPSNGVEAPEDVEVVTEEVGGVAGEDLQEEVEQPPGEPEAAVPEAAVPEAAVPEAAVPEAAVPEAAVPAEVATEEAVAAEPEEDLEPQFGRRDPKEKAQRLARVLVSDMILYNPDRHEQALEAGQVKEEFEDEIQKSWDEYVEQVGDEVANGTPFFTEALNEILAKGEDIF